MSKMSNPGSSVLLTVKDLSVALKVSGQLLLDHISFSIGRQERLGLSGLSGAGKSILTKAMLGLLPEELIVLSGQLVADHTTYDLRIPESLAALRGKFATFIFQESVAALNPVFSIGNQIIDVIRQHEKISKDRARLKALDLFADVGLNEHVDLMKQYAHQISGGMAQRVGIALALACQPKLLIADEPTSALDVFSQETIINLLAKVLQKYNMSLLFISHDKPLLDFFCSRIIHISNGRVQV